MVRRTKVRRGEEFIAHAAKHYQAVVAEREERNRHPDDHQYNRQYAGDPVVIEQIEIVVEVVFGLMAHALHERLYRTVGEFSRHHGEQRREGEGFGGRIHHRRHGDGDDADDQAAGKRTQGDVHVKVVHKDEARDVAEGGKEAERPKRAAFGIADARETNGGNGGKEAVVEQIEKSGHGEWTIVVG